MTTAAIVLTANDEDPSSMDTTMTRPKFLMLVSIDEGTQRGRPAPTAAAAELRDTLIRMLSGGPAPVPGHSGFWLTGKAHGRCLTLELSGGYDLVAMAGVAGHQRCGAITWRVIAVGASAEERQPPAPWAAFRKVGQAVPDWFPELLEGIAWAWIESREETGYAPEA